LIAEHSQLLAKANLSDQAAEARCGKRNSAVSSPPTTAAHQSYIVEALHGTICCCVHALAGLDEGLQLVLPMDLCCRHLAWCVHCFENTHAMLQPYCRGSHYNSNISVG
jgi:hypothetical protein